MSKTESGAEKRAKATAGRAALKLAKALAGSARHRALLIVDHTARLNMGAAPIITSELLQVLKDNFKTPEARSIYNKIMAAEEAQRLQILAARAALSELMEFVEKYAGSWALKKNLEAMTVNLNNLLRIFATPRRSKVIRDTFLEIFKLDGLEKILEKFEQAFLKHTVEEFKQAAIGKIINEFEGPNFRFRLSLVDPHNPIRLDDGEMGQFDIDRELGDIKSELYKAQDKLKTLIKVNRDLLAAHKVKIKPYVDLIDQIDKYAGAIGRLRGLDIRPWENAEINQELYARLTENIITWKSIRARGR